MSLITCDTDVYRTPVQSRYAASVVVSLTYGKRIDSVDEWIVKENMASMACRLDCYLDSFTID